MTSHALSSLLASANDMNNSTEAIEFNITLTTLDTTNPPLTTSPKIFVTKILSTTTSKTQLSSSTIAPVEDDSHIIFAFCTILFIVAVALVVKIIYSNKK